ncbi:sarcosine oxidase subunit gamma [Rhizobium sp. RAF56]|jgi:sarcosine oxidase subunit gamma|uniref:sarcosine oxidase subunit gamma n=1 Tax=Rhizobium sp. RAF56 TaxID=3233062 RepID=UPI003F975D41
MSIAYLDRHVLDERLASTASQPNANHLAIVRRFAAVSVLVNPGDEGEVLASLSATPAISVRMVGPFEWLAVSETLDGEGVVADLSRLDAGRVSLVDQSDGRVLFRVSGPNVRAILAKCVAVDLHPDVFHEGRSANMLCCHVSANVACTGGDVFEIVVMRSYAGFVFDELMEMGREFALTAGFAA